MFPRVAKGVLHGYEHLNNKLIISINNNQLLIYLIWVHQNMYMYSIAKTFDKLNRSYHDSSIKDIL